jgi:tRNA nucleotidyltransferase/poly(A) polymerase
VNVSDPIQEIDRKLYLDRWIAVVKGRVIGVGLTASQAHRAAKAVRPKDKPQLFFVDGQGNIGEADIKLLQNETWLNRQPRLGEVIQILQNYHGDAYLVGGAVRDLLLGRAAKIDLDFAVSGDGLAVARHVADTMQAAFYPLDANRGTGRVVLPVSTEDSRSKTYLDFASFRGPTIQADLAERDITINAMALSLTDPPQLIDPLHGQQDLEKRQIRATSDRTFRQDPVRVLRAMRQAVELGFAIEPITREQLQQAASELQTVSPERQRDELLKLLNTNKPGQALRLLHRLGVLSEILPEIEATVGVKQGPPHHLDVFEHTAKALDSWMDMIWAGLPDIPARLRPNTQDYLQQKLTGDVTLQRLMPLALLWHDSGKPATRTEEDGPDRRVRFLGHERKSAIIARQAMKHFRFSNQAVAFVDTVISHHMRPLLLAKEKSLSRRAMYRLFRDTSHKGIQAGVAVALHALADHRAIYLAEQEQAERQTLCNVVDTLVTTYFEHYEQVVGPPPLLTGRDLIDIFGLTEGRLIGLLLNRLQEAQATGQVQDKAEALAFIEADPDFTDYRRKYSAET